MESGLDKRAVSKKTWSLVARMRLGLLLLFIPVVNLIIAIITMIALAQNFGKGAGYGIGLILLPVIFMPMLAFGSARYVGAPAQPAAA